MSEEKPIEQMSADEAKAEIDTRLSDFSRPYWDKNHHLHREDVEQMRRLHEVAFPQKGEGSHDGLAERLEKEGVRTVEDVERIAAEKKTGNDEDDSELSPEEKEALDGLKRDWGDDYQANLTVAQETYEGVASQYGDDGFRALMEGGLGNDPAIIRLFYKIGKDLKEAAERED